jgi:peptide/nickel transport system ATP-binding protein
LSILEVKGLSVSFTRYRKGFRRQTQRVIDDLHLTVDAGEILAVVGASGSGKSLLAHAILGILPVHAQVSGAIFYRGKELNSRRQEELRGREIAFVPQSVLYLNPLMRVGKQVRTAVRVGDPAAVQRAAFERFGLSPSVEKRYPFQLSGGMARRVLVSIAAVSGANLIIADEPTPGLDPAVIAESLSVFRELADRGGAVMIISHDIDSVLKVADRIAVFNAGTVVEIARAKDFEGSGEALRHPYTRALWRALPQNGFSPAPWLVPFSPDATPGCSFARGCERVTEACFTHRPEATWSGNRMVRCIHGA